MNVDLFEMETMDRTTIYLNDVVVGRERVVILAILIATVVGSLSSLKMSR